MAYSPIDQAALARHAALGEIGHRLGASAAAVALAWLLGRGAMAIPKAVRSEHLRENLVAAALELDEPALRAIDAAFPPPRRATALAIN